MSKADTHHRFKEFTDHLDDGADEGPNVPTYGSRHSAIDFPKSE